MVDLDGARDVKAEGADGAILYLADACGGEVVPFGNACQGLALTPAQTHDIPVPPIEVGDALVSNATLQWEALVLMPVVGNAAVEAVTQDRR